VIILKCEKIIKFFEKSNININNLVPLVFLQTQIFSVSVHISQFAGLVETQANK